MSPEMAAMLRPLELPEDVRIDPTPSPLLALAKEHMVDVLVGLHVAGRDGAALLVSDAGKVVVVFGSRGAIREQLLALGPAAAACARRLEVRAPRGCWFLAVVVAGRATTIAVTSPGSELDAKGAA